MSDGDQHEKYVRQVAALAAEGAFKGAVSLAGPAGLLVELGRMAVSTFLTTGTQRLQDAVQEQIADAALRRLPEVERHVEELCARGVGVSPSDFSKVLRDFAKATQACTDEKKRKLLEDAFVNSFSPELYEASLLAVLWEKLERVPYGALRLLGALAPFIDDTDQMRRVVAQHQNGLDPATIGGFLVATLVQEQLAWTNVPQGGGVIKPTGLGVMMTKLCAQATPT